MCEELCQLMAHMKMEATESSTNTGSDVGAVFADLFVFERDLTETEIETLDETWIGIEDTQKVVDAIADEYLDKIEMNRRYHYEIEKEVEEVARLVAKHKYKHLQAMKAMDLLESYISVN